MHAPKAHAARSTSRSPVRSLAFSPDGTLLATFDNKGTVAVVEWASNQTLTNFTVPPPRHGGAGVVVFSPDGNRLAIGEDYGRLRILNWRTGTVVTMTNLTQTSDGVSALAFSPNRRTARGRLWLYQRTIRLWDARLRGTSGATDQPHGLGSAHWPSRRMAGGWPRRVVTERSGSGASLTTPSFAVCGDIRVRGWPWLSCRMAERS